MTLNKNDFIEIEFTGTSNGEIFDTTSKEEAKSIGLDANVKPLIISIGNNMLLKGLDENLIGKEIGKEYFLNLTPEKAFGKRDPKLIRTLPMKIFKEKNLNPHPGMSFQLDNYIVKILSVSGGRVIADFNNPLAGKNINYKFKIKRKVEDNKEKINSLMDFFFKQKFDFEIKGNKVIFKDDKIKPLIEMMKPKFKEMTNFDFETISEKPKQDTGKKDNIEKQSK